MRNSALHAQGQTRTPWVQVWTLNALGVLIGVWACLNLTPLTFTLAAAAPFVAIALRIWKPDAFILGDSSYRDDRQGRAAWRPLASISLFWAVPGLSLVFRGLATAPIAAGGRPLTPLLLLAATFAAVIVTSEWRLRNLGGALAIFTSCLCAALGYVLTANVAFDRSPTVTVRAVVTRMEVVGDRDGNGASGHGTPTLHVSPLANRHIRWIVPVSRTTYARNGVGSQVCLATRAGAFGWRWGDLVECAADRSAPEP